jgi:hypothetical protein
MNRSLSILLSVAAAAVPGAALAQSQPATPPSEKMICKREAATGSVLKKKTCRTKAEWDALTEASRKDLDRLNAMDRSKSGVGYTR